MGRLERRDVGERADRRALGREVDQQDVAPRDRPLDAGEQDDAARAGVSGVGPRIEEAIVQRHRHGAVAVPRGAVHQRLDAVRDEIGRIGVGVRMQFGLYCAHWIMGRALVPGFKGSGVRFQGSVPIL